MALWTSVLTQSGTKVTLTKVTPSHTRLGCRVQDLHTGVSSWCDEQLQTLDRVTVRKVWLKPWQHVQEDFQRAAHQGYDQDMPKVHRLPVLVEDAIS